MATETKTMATIPNPQGPGMQAFPSYSMPNGTLSQHKPELSVDLHSVEEDVNQSKIASQGVNGVFNQSACSLQTNMSIDVNDSTKNMKGMKWDVDESSTDSKCGLCGRMDKGEVCHMCSQVNQAQDSPVSHSDDMGSERRCNCQNPKETGTSLSCHCRDKDSRSSSQKFHSQNATDAGSDQEPLSQNITHTSSVHMNSTDVSSIQDPYSLNSTDTNSILEPHSKTLLHSGSVHEPHSKKLLHASSVHEPHSQDSADSGYVRKYCSQDLIDLGSVPQSHSKNSTDTTSGREPHSRNVTRTNLNHGPESHQVPVEQKVTIDQSNSCVDGGENPDHSTEITTDTEKTFSLRTLTRKQKFIVFSFCMVGFANYLCLSLIAPFFPKEARDKGVSNLVSGWIFAAFPLTQFIFAPVFGKLLPIIGLKFMYLSGTFISGGCTILFGMLAYVDTDEGTETFIIMSFVLRFSLALGCCANQTACFALVAHEFKDAVGTIFGMGEVFVGLGFMCGPAVGGVLYGLGGFLMPFAVIGGIIFLTTILNFWIVPADEFVPEVSSEGISLFTLIKSYKTLVNCLTIAVAAMIWSILDPTLEPHLEEFNLGSELIGLIFLLMAAVYAIASPFWGRISDKMNDSRVILVIGCVMSAGGMLLLGPSTLLGFQKDVNILWLNVVSLIIIGVADSAAIIPTFDLLFKIAEEQGFQNDIRTYSIIAGIWGSMYALGDFLGPALGGFLLDEVGFQSMTTYIAIVTAVMAVILVVTILFDQPCCCKQKASDREKKSDEHAPLLGQKDDVQSYMANSNILDSYPPQRMATDMV